MKILWVASQLEGRGGIGRVVAAGAQALAARGHEVHVAGPRASDDLAPFGALPLHPWPRRSAKLARLLDLLPLLRRLRPEVVHFHAAAPHGRSIAIVRALRAGFGAPLVVATPHGSRPLHRRRAQRGARAPDLVIAPSRWAEARVRAAGARATSVVPGGVAVGAEPRFEAREPIALTLGRLDATKGIDVLLEAFAQIAPERPAWQLWIAGEGADRRSLEARASALGCDGRVRWLGWIDGDEKQRVLARAAIGALPSRRESFGGALLEMMERGLACVASEAGGAAELADEGRAARLVPPGDARALAAAIGALIDDDAARLALARAGRRHSEAFAWERVAEAYEAAYRLFRPA